MLVSYVWTFVLVLNATAAQLVSSFIERQWSHITYTYIGIGFLQFSFHSHVVAFAVFIHFRSIWVLATIVNAHSMWTVGRMSYVVCGRRKKLWKQNKIQRNNIRQTSANMYLLNAIYAPCTVIHYRCTFYCLSFLVSSYWMNK